MANENGTKMVGLPTDLINEIMAHGRDRNFYGPKIVEFEAMEINGVDAMDTWPALKAKVDGGMKVNSVVLGFRKAASDANVEWLVVKAVEDRVYLINTNLVTVEA